MFNCHSVYQWGSSVGRKPLNMNLIANSPDNSNGKPSGNDLGRETALERDLNGHFNEMSTRVKKLKTYWDAHTDKLGKIPCICDIELMDIYDISSHIALDDVSDTKDGFKNRFWGGELTWRFAFEGTGKFVASYQPECLADKLLARYQSIIQSQQPCWQKAMQVRGRYNSHAPVEALHLPLTGKDQRNVKHVLSIFDFASHATPR